MRVKITTTGVHDRDGALIPIGTVLTVQGDRVPAWLLNKAEIVAEEPAPAAVAVTNPAKATKAAKAVATAAAEEKAAEQ